ncbi:MAG: Ig-like domain-containing protein, partial [Methylococcaceae bacterium]
VVIDALGNDTDPENDALTITSVATPANGSAVITADGKISYTPNDDFTGTEVFEYTISDGNGGTDTAKVTVTVGDDNTAPDAVDDSASTVSGSKVVINALGNDTDPENDTLTITNVATPAHGTAVITTEGKISYTPNANFIGTEVFEYTISDGNGGTDTAKVTVIVGDDNIAPDANDDFTDVSQGTKEVIDVLGNDSDPDGDPLTIVDGSITAPGNGTATITADGKISYTPNDGFTGADSFKYTISDGNGGTDTATVNIDVKPDPAKASIVGATTINEGENKAYNVQLDHAVDKDTYYTIQVTDGSANRVDHSGAGQDIMWGGYFDIRNGWGQVMDIIYNAVPNSNYVGSGWHQAQGPSNASWDYTVSQNGSINRGNTLTVKVSAGETVSDSFVVDAWKEKVAVDLDAGNARGYREGTETFDLDIVSTTGSDTNIQLDNTHLDVNINDRTRYWTFSPIALDLNGDGIHTTALGDTEGRFDLLNNGKPIESGWLSGEDAFLAVDTNGNGIIDDRSELFGGAIGDGFAKLAGYDSNNDGVVDAQDVNFSDLQVWQDSNENHQTDEGELISLDEAGIASLNVDYTNEYAEDNSNVLLERGTATSTEGESIDMADVYFNIAPTAEELEGSDIDVQMDFSEFLSVDDNMDALLGESVETGLVTGAVSNTVTDTTTDSLQQLADLQDQEYVQGGY